LDIGTDGVLGISPSHKLYLNETLFIDSLVKQGLIRRKVVSFSLGSESPHIKFGGWDSAAIADE
jgi:hypothetical protein